MSASILKLKFQTYFYFITIYLDKFKVFIAFQDAVVCQDLPEQANHN